MALDLRTWKLTITLTKDGIPQTVLTFTLGLPNGQSTDYTVTDADLAISADDSANFAAFVMSAIAQASAKLANDFTLSPAGLPQS